MGRAAAPKHDLPAWSETDAVAATSRGRGGRTQQRGADAHAAPVLPEGLHLKTRAWVRAAETLSGSESPEVVRPTPPRNPRLLTRGGLHPRGLQGGPGVDEAPEAALLASQLQASAAAACWWAASSAPPRAVRAASCRLVPPRRRATSGSVSALARNGTRVPAGDRQRRRHAASGRLSVGAHLAQRPVHPFIPPRLPAWWMTAGRGGADLHAAAASAASHVPVRCTVPTGPEGRPARSASGTYAIRVHVFGAWRMLLIDDTVPVDAVRSVAPTAPASLSLPSRLPKPHPSVPARTPFPSPAPPPAP